jgi:adenylate kinase family enzyme
MKKKMIIINGPMGVGKSTICKEILNTLEQSVWLDGDWCWMMNPWNVSDKNIKMVAKNITYILRNYLSNTGFIYILFSWVIQKEDIINNILDKLKDYKFDLIKISIVCSEAELKKRMTLDNRNNENIKNSLSRLPFYYNMNTIKVDTTGKDKTETVSEILKIINKINAEPAP